MSRHLLCATLALAAVTTARAADPIAGAGAAGRPIDIVLCLDVSNSMDGLIDSAKIKLWDIVNDLAKIRPVPQLRVALYSYGNPTYNAEMGYVRQEQDLTNNLDVVYSKLSALKTHGGDEYVARVAKTALEQLRWHDDPKGLKILFVCGNESARQDSANSLEAVARLAVGKDVVVNTIHCAPRRSGDDDAWKLFAALGKGKGVNIDQSRNVDEKHIDCPQDGKIMGLNQKLNGTYMAYGARAVQAENLARQKAQDENAEKAAPAAGLGRAASKASGLYRNDAWDLVDRCKNDAKFDPATLPADQLPDELKAVAPAHRRKKIDEMAAERDGIQREIAKLSQEREAFLREARQAEAAQSGKPVSGDQALDEALRGLIREQAGARGLTIPK